MFAQKFIILKTAKGKTDKTDSTRKLFLNPLMLIYDITIDEIAHIATEKYSSVFKSKSSLRVMKENTVVRMNTETNDENTIFIM